ncbi:MAG: tetratricopeptide repeat protein [Spirochaetes bacterium]|nr:tetratricopeptide repeat protein [Spirochaetota bacterium]
MNDPEIYLNKAKEHFNSAVSLINNGKLTRAHRQLQIAEEFGYSKKDTMMYFGLIKNYENKLKDALDFFNKAKEESGKNCEIHYYLGHIYKDIGKEDLAVENYKVILRESKNILLKALSLREIRSFRKVNPESFQKLILLCLRNFTKKKLTFLDKRAFAIIELLKGNVNKSFYLTRELIKKNGNYIELFRDFSSLLLKMKNYSMAVSVLKGGLRKIPRDREMIWDLAKVLFKMKNYSESLNILLSFEAAGFKCPEMYYNISCIHLKNGHNVAAIKALKKSINLDQKYFPSLFNLAVIYHESGNLDIAQEFYEKAYISEPENYELLYNLGMLFFEIGDFSSSIRMLNKCFKINPDFKKAKENLFFVTMAKLCFPGEGPEEKKHMRKRYYILGGLAFSVVMLFTIFKGLLQ